jgi:hypothetical protein
LLRPLAAVALLIVQVGCGTITLAPDPDGAVPGAETSTSAPPSKPPPREAGPTAPGACATDEDCKQDKTKRCDTATGACVACLTDGDCDGDRTCSAGKCAGADGED